jgi:hypothetical protein
MEPIDDDQEPIKFGTEEVLNTLKVEKEAVSERDIFKLGKQILLVCAIVFVLVATLRATLEDSKGIIDVWDYSKIILNTITSLVLGLYFGNRGKA